MLDPHQPHALAKYEPNTRIDVMCSDIVVISTVVIAFKVAQPDVVRKVKSAYKSGGHLPPILHSLTSTTILNYILFNP